MVLISCLVHAIDVGLDLLVVLLFLAHMQWGFFAGSAGVILWAWLVSSLYVSFGGGGAGDAEDGSGLVDRLPQFFLSFVQVQIFAEAYRCVCRKKGSTDYFYTLRLMEAILESAPNALVQLYALIVWANTDEAPEGAANLLRLSVCAAVVSVGLGLAMWEQKVQFRASAVYISGVAVMRSLEIASRALTLAIFASLTHPYGLWWALLIDYGVMVGLIVGHQSVQFTYGLFVALPLVLVSLEPLVWRWEDHAVPKDSYYLVRILEFVLMWVLIVYKQDISQVPDGVTEAVPLNCKVLSLVSTLGLYLVLPFVWRIARRHELSRDVDWGDDDDAKDELAGDTDTDDEEGMMLDQRDDEEDLPPE